MRILPASSSLLRMLTIDPAVDPVIIARGTTGFSGADLQNLVNQVWLVLDFDDFAV